MLRFKNKKRVMPLNKTQTADLIAITGADNYDKWPGWVVILTPGTSSSKKDTITITVGPQPAPIAAPPKCEPAEIIKELYS